jgi:Sulfatase
VSDNPNILIIWGDDIGMSNLSCYSDGVMGYRTRNVDRIANEGVRFTDYYGEQSCTAGRSAFITGQNPYRTGLTKVGMPGAALGLQPGTVRSNLQRYITDDDLERTRVHIEDDSGSFHWKTPEQGAATAVLLATSPLLEGIGGRYFEDCNEAGPSQPGTGRGVAPYALDPDAAARLWEISLQTLAS